jgi:dihydroxyacetone kinase-like predicted kinase
VSKPAVTESFSYPYSRLNTVCLKEGDIIGMNAKDIVTKGNDVDSVTEELVDSMMDEDVTTISLYFGNNVTEEEAGKVADDLSQKYPKCDVDIYYGGQPLYYYIVSLE